MDEDFFRFNRIENFPKHDAPPFDRADGRGCAVVPTQPQPAYAGSYPATRCVILLVFSLSEKPVPNAIGDRLQTVVVNHLSVIRPHPRADVAHDVVNRDLVFRGAADCLERVA